jgi:hypothetical protein
MICRRRHIWCFKLQEGAHIMTRNHPREPEPTPADLNAIEAEWPLIDAELSLLDAEIRVLLAHGGPSPLDWRRLRRAERQVIAAYARMLACPAGDTPRRVAS